MMFKRQRRRLRGAFRKRAVSKKDDDDSSVRAWLLDEGYCGSESTLPGLEASFSSFASDDSCTEDEEFVSQPPHTATKVSFRLKSQFPVSFSVQTQPKTSKSLLNGAIPLQKLGTHYVELEASQQMWCVGTMPPVDDEEADCPFDELERVDPTSVYSTRHTKAAPFDEAAAAIVIPVSSLMTGDIPDECPWDEDAWDQAFQDCCVNHQESSKPQDCQADLLYKVPQEEYHQQDTPNWSGFVYDASDSEDDDESIVLEPEPDTELVLLCHPPEDTVVSASRGYSVEFMLLVLVQLLLLRTSSLQDEYEL